MAKKEETKVEYTLRDGQEIELPISHVMRFLVKGDPSLIETKELVNFMQTCKYEKLNPYLNEVYLIKFSAKQPAQIVVSKEAYLKRAELDDNFDGIETGIIILDTKGVVEERLGGFRLPEETLVGGWAKVYRRDRKVPYTTKVTMAEYAGDARSSWGKIPNTMIQKVAQVHALRQAFPNSMGGLYIADELAPVLPPSAQQQLEEEAEEMASEKLGMDIDTELETTEENDKNNLGGNDDDARENV